MLRRLLLALPALFAVPAVAAVAATPARPARVLVEVDGLRLRAPIQWDGDVARIIVGPSRKGLLLNARLLQPLDCGLAAFCEEPWPTRA